MRSQYDASERFASLLKGTKELETPISSIDYCVLNEGHPNAMSPLLSFQGLSDACLALSMDQRVVANDADADKQDLVIVTGANQGGKSIFPAKYRTGSVDDAVRDVRATESLCSSVRDHLFTLEAGRRYWHEKWQLRRGASAG